MSTGRPRRQARAVLVGGALTLLTLAGHAAGSAALPSLLGAGLVALLAGALGIAVAQRPLRWAPLVAVLLGGQALLHLVLTFTAGHAHGMPASAAPGATAMLLGHAIAAMAAAVVLAHADGLLARWGRFVSALLGDRSPTPITAAASASSCLAPQAVTRPATHFLLHQVIRRGPPAPALLT